MRIIPAVKFATQGNMEILAFLMTVILNVSQMLIKSINAKNTVAVSAHQPNQIAFHVTRAMY